MKRTGARVETERLYLRPYEEGDLEDAVRILGDASTMSFYPEPFSREKVQKVVLNNIKTYQKHGYGMFAMIRKEDEVFMGDCGITVQNIDGVNEFEIGYRIGKEFWGNGYAPEAAAAIRDYGFDVLQLKKLCSYMPSHHVQSRRVAEKTGMNLEKTFKNPRNRDIETAVYSIHA
jgi:RimJ/RimL family protein N-acetyltransferase